MRHYILVTVDTERQSGKFAGRDEIAAKLIEEIESGNPESLDGLGADGESEYSVEDWTVEEVDKKRAERLMADA
jgi:hypothetical protein